MSDQELKPCPFCQQPLKVVDGEMVHPFSWCILSGVSLPIENAGTWNTRTPDPMLEELAGALEGIVRCLSHGLQDCMASVIAKDMLGKYQQWKRWQGG